VPTIKRLYKFKIVRMQISIDGKPFPSRQARRAYERKLQKSTKKETYHVSRSQKAKLTVKVIVDIIVLEAMKLASKRRYHAFLNFMAIFWKKGVIGIIKQIPKDIVSVGKFVENSIVLGISFLVANIIPFFTESSVRKVIISNFKVATERTLQMWKFAVVNAPPRKWMGLAAMFFLPFMLQAQASDWSNIQYSPLMFWIYVGIFAVGIVMVALEEKIKFDKEATVLGMMFLLGTLLWYMPEVLIDLNYIPEKVLATFKSDISLHDNLMHHLEYEMGHHTMKISEIIFFLLFIMGAVTIAAKWGALKLMADGIKSENVYLMLFRLAVISFFGSALFDNLANTILMIGVMKEMIPKESKELRLQLGAFIVILANAGGAWSPIGDVTTTMLWIGQQISATGIVTNTIVPSLIVAFITLIWFSYILRNINLAEQYAISDEILQQQLAENKKKGIIETTKNQKTIMLTTLIVGIISIPILKMLLHLPTPFYAACGTAFMVWTMSEILDRKMINPGTESHGHRRALSSLHDLHSNAFYFFTAILFSVAFLEEIFALQKLATELDGRFSQDGVAITLSILSGLLDNVPLVAGAQGMYDYPQDSKFWYQLAYGAGVGGNIMPFGSAAGVAAMSLLDGLTPTWWLKNISILALLGLLIGFLPLLF